MTSTDITTDFITRAIELANQNSNNLFQKFYIYTENLSVIGSSEFPKGIDVLISVPDLLAPNDTTSQAILNKENLFSDSLRYLTYTNNSVE